jgi:hypothetical protein
VSGADPHRVALMRVLRAEDEIAELRDRRAASARRLAELRAAIERARYAGQPAAHAGLIARALLAALIGASLLLTVALALTS